MVRFLDTNILLRYLTGDDEHKAGACLDLLLKVERGDSVDRPHQEGLFS